MGVQATTSSTHKIPKNSSIGAIHPQDVYPRSEIKLIVFIKYFTTFLETTFYKSAFKNEIPTICKVIKMLFTLKYLKNNLYLYFLIIETNYLNEKINSSQIRKKHK